MTNVYAKLTEAMASAGVAPAGDMEAIADGKIHRYRVDGDKSGSLNGWYFLDHDGEHYYGAFGSWKQDSKHTFTSREENQLSEKQRFLIKRRIDERKRQRDAEIKEQQEEAAKRAQTIYASAKPLTSELQHPYLKRKMAKPFSARLFLGALVLPVTNFEGEIQSLQFIAPNGDKKLLAGGKKKGNFIPVLSKPNEDGPNTVFIAEGFATATTLAQAYSIANIVLASVDAGNLKHVALGVRDMMPDATIMIGMDRDEVGMAKAREAAKACRGQTYLPGHRNGEPLPEHINDFNDLYVYEVKRGEALPPSEVPYE